VRDRWKLWHAVPPKKVGYPEAMYNVRLSSANEKRWFIADSFGRHARRETRLEALQLYLRDVVI
jgi:hypothetical protein